MGKYINERVKRIPCPFIILQLDDAIQDKDGLKAGVSTCYQNYLFAQRYFQNTLLLMSLAFLGFFQDLLSFEHSHVANPRLQIERPEPSVQRVFDTPIDELVAAHIR